MGVIKTYKLLVRELVRARRKTTSSRSARFREKHEERWRDCLDEMDRFLTTLESDGKKKRSRSHADD